MTRKPYKYKVGDKVLTPIGILVKHKRVVRRKKYIESIITGKTSAGGVKKYRLSNGGWKMEEELYPIIKSKT